MSKIIELPEALANQIAAGEVVERPASVVKELVENAIDAGATRIRVEVAEAGLKRIVVSDNGQGMSADDLPLALRRHATSKIQSPADLFRIRTLGFRGEALPSIAAVSQLTIETAESEALTGTRLTAKGGRITATEPVSPHEGTQVTVDGLFFNTPARLKYVKSLQAELSHITDILNRLALGHPEIALTLTSDGRELLRSSGSGELKQVMAQIYGLANARKLLAVEASDLDFELTGYISLPELTRTNRSYISLLLNGRYIKNFALNRAIIEGYGSKLMVGRFPLVVLAIRIDPQLVDVNVHPTKQEVRLSKERELMSLITRAIAAALSQETLIPRALDNLSADRQADFSERAVAQEGQVREAPVSYTAGRRNRDRTETEPDLITQAALASLSAQHSQASQLTDAVEAVEASPALDGPAGFPELTYLGQLHATYLLAQAPGGLYLVDQHAAQERIKYEYWRDKIGQVSYDQQTLLVPVIIDLPKNDFLTVAARRDELGAVGIFLADYGESSFVLRGHPVWMRDGEEESATLAMIDLLLADRAVTVKEYRAKLAIMMSCKAAIKAGMPITPEAARSLLRQLAACEDPYNCPHGRPAIVKFTRTDIEKMFRRIQASHDSARLSALGE